MASTAPARRCARNGCGCLIEEGQTYCGPHCANAAADTPLAAVDDHCGCGHGGCASHTATTKRIGALAAAAAGETDLAR
ncbi:hypothetical protein [Dokdonella koreensis]|uniref:Uncharacterized protein n=1 Tax=Dokdonella koreensis DS-123 TaxID=1300342 RepID=A0A160DXT3_9GAMM|nr:hypothetical protein [Dokdonella koreensis]ANB19559.1 Hypothetical protein I596_3571 [Dokdonella koreensis DS-123]